MKTRSPKRSDPWQKVSLGDCGAWKSGGTPSTKEADYWDGDIPWFTSSSLTSFRLRQSDRTLTEVGLENGSRLVQPGTLLFVVRGSSLDTEFRVGITQQASAFGQDCKALIAAHGINAEFLGYSLKGHEQVILGMVSHAAHGAAKLDTDFLQGLGIPMPPLEIQENVVGVLASFDDLIEKNRRRIELLDETARLLYREWFVNFRYPGHEEVPLVDSELGSTPEGWNVGRISDLGQVVTGTTPPTKEPELYGDEAPFLTPTDISGGCIARPSRGLSSAGIERFEKRMVPRGSTSFTCIGSIGEVCMTTESTLTNQQINSVVPESQDLSSFIYLLLKENVPRILNYASGSAVPIINKTDFSSIKIILPPFDLISEFCELFNPIHSLVEILNDKVETLTRARDLLLPRLVSGELDVSDLELTG